MNTITIEENLFEQLRQIASKQGQDVNQYATAIISREVRYKTAQNPVTSTSARTGDVFVPFDPDAIRKRYMEKYGMPDLSHFSKEELAEAAELEIARMDTKTRLELEEKGFL